MQSTIEKQGKFVNLTMDDGKHIYHIYRFDETEESKAILISSNINAALSEGSTTPRWASSR